MHASNSEASIHQLTPDKGLAPAQIGGYRRPLLEKHADELRAIVSSKAGITLKEMRDALHARGIVVKALSTIADMLHRLGLSHKKRA